MRVTRTSINLIERLERRRLFAAFAVTPWYTVGSRPTSAATADFNSDGKIDVAVASSGATVLLNQGNGAFAGPVTYTAGSGPSAIATGDFNGDGKPDMVVANKTGGTVSVFRNTGSGAFAARVNYTVGSQPAGVAVADFNRDGRADIVTCNGANGTSNSISVLINTGSGAFATRVDYGLSAISGAVSFSVVTGDFNGDGYADVAAAVFGNGINVLQNSGTGTFGAPVLYDVPYAAGLVAADLNGDGKLDLAASTTSSSVFDIDTVKVLLNKGSGTFKDPAEYATGSYNFQITAGDVDGDGAIDLATANYNGNSVSVLRNTGGGTFHSRTDYGVGEHPIALVVADFNNDSRIDLVSADNFSNRVSVLLNGGGGALAGRRDYVMADVADETATSTGFTADFDQDGRLDAIIVGAGGGLLMNAGNGAIGEPSAFYAPGKMVGMTASDFTRDGKLDLAIAYNNSGGYPNSYGIWINAYTNETFVTYRDLPLPSAATGLVSGDLNQDGYADLVASLANGSVAVLKGSAGGVFSAPIIYAVNSSTQSNQIAIGDVNGDGYADLAVCGATAISMLSNNGSGGFALGNTISASSAEWPVIVDLNHDGKNDVAYLESNTVNVALKSGPTFATPKLYIDSTIMTSLAAADFTGDGIPDLVAGAPFNGATNGTDLFVNKGDGTFAINVRYITGGGTPLPMDLNDDGYMDVATANRNGTVSVLLNTQGPLNEAPYEVLARGVAYKDWLIFTPGMDLDFPGVMQGTYKVDQVFNNTADGFYAVGLTSDTFGPALALRGTNDLASDLLWSDSDPQGVGYRQFSDNWGSVTIAGTVSWWLNNHPGADVVGHSLGGALAQWVASAWTAAGHSLDQVVTFNSPGISDNVSAHPGLLTYAHLFTRFLVGGVTHYVVNGDAVSMAGEAFITGTVKLADYSSSVRIDHYALEKHTTPLLTKVGSKQPPSDISWSSLPMATVNSPNYGHSALGYRAWLLGLRVLTTNVLLWDFAPAVSALWHRGTAESKRAEIGEMLRAVIPHTNDSTNSAIFAAVQSGDGATLGAWDGASYSGMQGFGASAGVNGQFAIGVASASDAMGLHGTDMGTWHGQSVDAFSVLLGNTYAGDANLDGKLNVDDYTRIDFNVSLGTNGWFNGDFNYDGKINVDDYTIIDFNVGIQGPPLANASSAIMPASGRAAFAAVQLPPLEKAKSDDESSLVEDLLA